MYEGHNGCEFSGTRGCLPLASKQSDFCPLTSDFSKISSSLCRTWPLPPEGRHAPGPFHFSAFGSRFYKELMTNAQFSISNIQVGKTAEKEARPLCYEKRDWKKAAPKQDSCPHAREDKKILPKPNPYFPYFPYSPYTSIPPYLHTSIPHPSINPASRPCLLHLIQTASSPLRNQTGADCSGFFRPDLRVGLRR